MFCKSRQVAIAVIETIGHERAKREGCLWSGLIFDVDISRSLEGYGKRRRVFGNFDCLYGQYRPL